MILFNYVLFLELFEAEYEDEEDEEDVINDEKNEEDEINERCECVICFEKHRAIIFDPCGHIMCCLDCSVLCNDCPICRAVIVKKMKFYVP